MSKKNALGRPHGFLCDTQGTLFNDSARIIEHHRSAAFLMENVKYLQRHDRGRTFATIMRVFEDEVGCRVNTRVVESPWVPQKRERIFIAGFPDPVGLDFDRLEMPAGTPPSLGTILDAGGPPPGTVSAIPCSAATR